MSRLIFFLLICVAFSGCSSTSSNANKAKNAPSPTTSSAEARAAMTPAPIAIDPNADSIYTELSDKICKDRTPEPDSGAIYAADCPGTAGYKVYFSASDHSQLLSLTDPAGRETNLPFPRIVSSAAGFVLGDKIEWRMDSKNKDAKPYALIVRINKFIDPEDFNKTEKYLAVVNLRSDRPCVTDLVPGSTDQNLKARQLADVKDRECIPVERP